MGGWKQYPSKHIPKSPPTDFSCNTGEEDNPENLVHNWFWHLFDIIIIIKISLASAVMWTVGYGVYVDGPGSDGDLKHIFTYGFTKDPPNPHMAAPLLIVLVGMGLVYAIYPGIAPGMIVPFYLIDKIEMVLLVATIVPALGVAMVNKFDYPNSPKYYEGWEGESHGTDPFDGEINYTTTKDITSIIITGIPTSIKTSETTPIPIKGTVKIKTDPVDGNCDEYTKEEFADPTPIQIADATQAKITINKDGKATLEITININADSTLPNTTDALDALALLAIPVERCKVSVAGDTLTIEITYADKAKGCTDIVITGNNLATALQALGLKSTTNTETVRVAPAPNHLTIKYGSEKKITGAVATAKGAEGMTAITEVIAKKIIDEIRATNDKAYYHVTDPKTNIRYSFKLDTLQANQLTDDTPVSTTINVDYGHMFAEGFGDINYVKASMVSPLLIVLVGIRLAYGYFLDTQIKDAITSYPPSPNVTFHKSIEGTDNQPKVEHPKNLDLENLTAEDIDSITVIDSKGKAIATYTNTKDPKGPTAPDTHTLIIKKDGAEGETEATFTKSGDPTTTTGTQGAPNTITLTTTDRKTITITGITDTP